MPYSVICGTELVQLWCSCDQQRKNFSNFKSILLLLLLFSSFWPFGKLCALHSIANSKWAGRTPKNALNNTIERIVSASLCVCVCVWNVWDWYHNRTVEPKKMKKNCSHFERDETKLNSWSNWMHIVLIVNLRASAKMYRKHPKEC